MPGEGWFCGVWLFIEPLDTKMSEPVCYWDFAVVESSWLLVYEGLIELSGGY